MNSTEVLELSKRKKMPFLLAHWSDSKWPIYLLIIEKIEKNTIYVKMVSFTKGIIKRAIPFKSKKEPIYKKDKEYEVSWVGWDDKERSTNSLAFLPNSNQRRIIIETIFLQSTEERKLRRAERAEIPDPGDPLGFEIDSDDE